MHAREGTLLCAAIEPLVGASAASDAMQEPSEDPEASAPLTNAPLTNAQWRVFVVRAWRGRCPRCGRAPLFERTFRLHAACTACGLVYRRESGAMTGQMYLSAAVTELIAAALALGLFFLTDWGPTTSLLVTLPLVVGFSYWFLPKAMGLWVAVEFMTDLGNREPWSGR